MMLDVLGPRICIMGPSNSGKATLAEAIARAQGLKAVHLDQLQHVAFSTTRDPSGRRGAAVIPSDARPR